MMCPTCNMPTKTHADESYQGEMRECPKCGFTAYDDQWNKDGKYVEPTNDPF